MSFAITSQPRVCPLKLRPKESNGVILIAAQLLRNQNYEIKHIIYSSNYVKLNSNYKFMSTMLSAPLNLIRPTTRSTGEGETEKMKTESNSRTEKLSWVELYLPKEAQPYARLARIDRPMVTWLYIWPSFWAIALAAPPGNFPDWGLLTLFGIASLFLRGYGCAINDLYDCEVDKKVHRSKQRPIASGVVTPFQAISFAISQLFTYLAILLPVLNKYSKVMAIPVFPLFSTYPLMKRITDWPQAYLGIAINWNTFVAWSAVKGSLDLLVVVPLFISLFFWTLSYDTIYAHQDRADDVKVGVKSTAVLFGDSTKIWCTGFSIASIICLAISGLNAKIGWPFYASLLLATRHLAWQVKTVDLLNPQDCKNKFLSNCWFGLIIFIGICLGRLVY